MSGHHWKYIRPATSDLFDVDEDGDFVLDDRYIYGPEEAKAIILGLQEYIQWCEVNEYKEPKDD